jgi:hypothetical protein
MNLGSIKYHNWQQKKKDAAAAAAAAAKSAKAPDQGSKGVGADVGGTPAAPAASEAPSAVTPQLPGGT